MISNPNLTFTVLVLDYKITVELKDSKPQNGLWSFWFISDNNN